MRKKEPDLKQAFAVALFIVGVLIAYRLGIFNAVAGLFVNHAISVTQEETKRQQEANRQKAAK